MTNRPSRPEIEAQALLAHDWVKTHHTAIYHSTYEEGVKDALDWVSGKGDAPIQTTHASRFEEPEKLEATTSPNID